RFEPNDSFGAATDLGTLGDLTEADLPIHEPYKFDFYLLTAAYSGTLNVDILFSNSLGDLTLYVYDSSPSRLAYSISTRDYESVSVAVTGGETYYVVVFGSADATHPDYDLVIDGPQGPQSVSVYACDLDGDGKSDLLWREGSTGKYAGTLMNGLSKGQN
ncbi:unnamed protein product, partial [marine sediment metagenome]